MVLHKRKKNSRLRGSKSHGWGAKKKHRGSGNKGGKGMAGTGKRGDSKKPSIWHERYFGRYGFKKKNIKRIIKPITIFDLEERLDNFVGDKLITINNSLYIIDLSDIGFNKLLGKGRATRKYKITTEFASKKAIDKIKGSGGEIVLNQINQELPQEKEK